VAADWETDFRAAVGAYAAFEHGRAAELFERLARDGHSRAQRMLGFMYSNGQGVPRNERIAAEWYCRSVERGLWGPGGCPWFVYLTREEPGIALEGLGVTDGESWLKHLRQARQGQVASQVAVGLLYASGVGTPRDLVEAYRWLALAAEQRHPTAGQLLEALEREMTREQIAEGRRLAGLGLPAE
jgi:TPR repeat protein